MTPERWQKIEELYQAALNCEASQRAEFLAQACAEDEALRGEVESLLAAHLEAQGFLEQPAHLLSRASDSGSMAGSVRIGQQLKHYQIAALLGKGGMGEVYLAEDRLLGRKVALKLLPSQFTQERERLFRFEQEARAASALNHPNIITIYEIGFAEGMHFIVTEYVAGQTLRQRMRTTAMRLSDILEISAQVASALHTAHEAGIIHRDIKPENVMVRPDGYVKVLDFGLAKLLLHKPGFPMPMADSEDPTKELLQTDPGKMMGTARYMSPEQIRGLEVDGRSDIFSLGVMLYELLSGQAPFQGATAGEVMANILNHEPVPLSQLAPAVPALLAQLVARSLAKDRETRHATVAELLKELKLLKLDLELAAKLERDGAPTECLVDLASDPPVAPPTTQSLYSTQISPTSRASLRDALEPVGGAVPLSSKFYIQRPTDVEFQAAIARRDSIVLVKGARQVGKTSLLARGLQYARETGAKVVLTDFQSLNAECLTSIEKLFLTLAGILADQLELDVFPDEAWREKLSPSINFERYLRREVLTKLAAPVVWGVDEVDQLFTCPFGSEVFGLFRSWHNKRALDPQGPWHRLTLAIAYATEAHLFITNLNQSPFNVGTRLQLEDFTVEQVNELNRRYSMPLREDAELARFYQLVGGHPYLVRRGLYEIAAHGLTLDTLEAQAQQEESPYSDHLHRLLLSLQQDTALCEDVRAILRGEKTISSDNFYRLRGAGLMVGETPQKIRPRCQLYAAYLEKHLL
jgi:serine/threonine protein kinase